MDALNASPILEWGVASRALPGEPECGDRYLVETYHNGALAAVVDGLGHGPQASTAALTAIGTLHSHPTESILTLVQRCHAALLETRGVALSLVSFDATAGKITWLAVGNVEGVLLHKSDLVNVSRTSIFMRGGVVGYQLPPLKVDTLPISAGDLLVLATDGVAQGFIRDIQWGSPVQTLADQILARYGRSTDDTLALVIRYRGGTE